MEKLVVYFLDGMHVLVFIRITCCESTTCQFFFCSITIHYNIYKVTNFLMSRDCIEISEVKVVSVLLPYITKFKYTQLYLHCENEYKNSYYPILRSLAQGIQLSYTHVIFIFIIRYYIQNLKINISYMQQLIDGRQHCF